jgi:hypothetical protein
MALDPNDPYALATWDEDLEARFLAGVGTPYGVDPMVQPAPMQITAPVGAPPQEAPAAAIAQPLTPQEEAQIEIVQRPAPVQNTPDFQSRAPGGSRFDTPLSTDDEQEFQSWAKENRAPITDDYDMRGFWKALKSGDPRAETAINPSDNELHFPDTWKTPIHHSFSNESIYADADAPHWEGNVLVDKDGRVVVDERTPEERSRPSFAGSSVDQAPAPTMEVEPELGLADQFTNVIPSAIAVARNPMTDDELSQDALNDKYTQMALTDPEVYAKVTAKQDIDRHNREVDEQLRIANEDRDRLLEKNRLEQEAFEQHRKDMAASDAEIKQLAEEDIDGDRWMDSRSTLQTIAAFTAAIVGGLNQHNTGGRNMGLEAIEREIDRDVEIQKANLAKRERLAGMKRDSVQQRFQTEMEWTRSLEVRRQALYQVAQRGLQIEMSKYDPRGTTAQRIADSLVNLQAAQQAARAKAEQQNLENRLKFGDLVLKARDADLKALQIQEKQKKLQGGGPSQRFPRSYWVAQGLPDPGVEGLTDKDYNTWLTRKGKAKDLGGNDAKSRKEAAEATKAEAEAAAAKTGFQVSNPVTKTPLKNKDGEPFVIMDATERQKARDIMTAAANIRRLADKMAELKRKYGGAIGSLGGDEAQEIKSLASQIDFETFKAFDLGAPSEGDKALAEGVRGGADPTSFIKDATKGFQTYAEGVEKKMNTLMSARGYDGDYIKLPRAGALEKAEASVVDEIVGELTKDKHVAADKDSTKFLGMKVDPRFDINHGLSKASEERIFQLEAYADQPGDIGDQARRSIRKLAKDAPTPELRARMKALSEKLTDSNARTGAAR